jgi:hypothetical protein
MLLQFHIDGARGPDAFFGGDAQVSHGEVPSRQKVAIVVKQSDGAGGRMMPLVARTPVVQISSSENSTSARCAHLKLQLSVVASWIGHFAAHR